MLHFSNLTKKILDETEITSLYAYTCSNYMNPVYVCLDTDSVQLKCVLNKYNILYAYLAPNALAFWDNSLNKYVQIVFPREILPELRGERVQIFRACYSANMTLPRLFYFAHERSRESFWRTHNPNYELFNLISSIDVNTDYKINYLRDYSIEEYWYLFGSNIIVNLCTITNRENLEKLEKFSQLNFAGRRHPYLFKETMMEVLTRASNPSYFFRNLDKLNLLQHFMPELVANKDCIQDERWHNEDVFNHLMRTVDCAPMGKPLVRLAALLHDVGKAATRKIAELEQVENGTG